MSFSAKFVEVQKLFSQNVLSNVLGNLVNLKKKTWIFLITKCGFLNTVKLDAECRNVSEDFL